jgi:hypothetical protein
LLDDWAYRTCLSKIQTIRAIKNYPKFWEGKGKGK